MLTPSALSKSSSTSWLPETSIVLIHWGCHRDLRRTLNLGPNARIFVVDSHRPVHLHNLSDQDDEKQVDLAYDFEFPLTALANVSTNIESQEEREGSRKKKKRKKERFCNLFITGASTARHLFIPQRSTIQPHQFSVQVTSPYGNNLHHRENTTHGSFAFTTQETGNYLACFWVDSHDQGAGEISVNLDWKIGIAAKDWDTVAKKEKIEGVELELRKLEGSVEAIHENLLYLKGREKTTVMSPEVFVGAGVPCCMY